MSKFQSWCECAYCGHRFIETFEFPLTEVVICPNCGKYLEWGGR